MDFIKYAISLLLIIDSCDVFVESKVYSDRLSVSNDKIHKISRGVFPSPVTQYRDRQKRSPGGDTGDTGQPIVNITTLPDSNHNEAIVHWSGNNSDVMFILTRQHSYSAVNDSKLWRSDDYGTSFKDVTKQITSTGTLSFYQISPNDKNILLFVDKNNKTIYSTVDEGKTYKTAKVDFVPNKLVFHPTMPKWVLAYSQTERTLYYSDDLFASYSPVHSNVNPRFFWADPVSDKDDHHIVHMEIMDSQTGHYLYKAVTTPYPKDVTVDSRIGNIDVNSLLVEKEYIFIQKTTPFYSHLYVSYNRGPFKKAYFPQSRHPQDFTVVTADEHQVFIAANHHEGVVSLYLSDPTGQFYTTSLNNVVSLKPVQGGFEADLYEVKGMPGTYIANQHTASNPRTLITFDQGGKWQIIPAPEKDLNGKPYNCTTQPKSVNCGLHLHLQFSSEIYHIPYLLSETNAPGKILAHGVVGTELTPKNYSLFMSSNGGLTWRPVFADQDQYLVKILDQGAAMVSMPIKAGRTDSIKYSSTEGKTWQSYKLTTKNGLNVEGVINEPGIDTLVVSVFGHDTQDAGWTIVKINFTSVLSRACDTEDFESWIPSDEVGGSGCLLGQRMIYERRKIDSQCFISRDYERPINVTLCQCRDEDYECDYGYVRDEKDPSKCNLTSWYNPKEPVGDCPEDTKYMKSKGYRKVAADKCAGGLAKYDSVKAMCPVVRPADLYLSVKDGVPVLATGDNVTFQLTQLKGSKKKTKYSWKFSDESSTSSVGGFDKGQYLAHTFKKKGMYSVTVSAEHPDIKEGATTASLTVLVEDHLQGLEVLIPHGAQIKKEVTLQAMSLANTLGSHVHFIWSFGDEEKDERPMLTWNQSVQHVYKKPGNYTALVEAFNNLGSIFREVPVVVYGTLSTVQLRFNLVADKINTQTQIWRDLFGAVLKKALIEALSLEPSRLEVVVLPKLPTLADVSILPSRQSMTSDPTINVITTEILKIADSKKLRMTLGQEEFFKSQTINVTGGLIVTENQPSTPEKKQSYVAVYICVPLLMAAVFITVLIVMYYKKKFRQLNRYSLLEARAGEPDALLDDTDDDDPLLDAHSDQAPERLAFSDDDMDDPLSAHLRLGAGSGRQLNINC